MSLETFSYQFVGLSVCWLVCRLVGWSVRWLEDLSVGWVVCQFVCWSVSWLAGLPVEWLVCQLVGWSVSLACQLVGWSLCLKILLEFYQEMKTALISQEPYRYYNSVIIHIFPLIGQNSCRSKMFIIFTCHCDLCLSRRLDRKMSTLL